MNKAKLARAFASIDDKKAIPDEALSSVANTFGLGRSSYPDPYTPEKMRKSIKQHIEFLLQTVYTS